MKISSLSDYSDDDKSTCREEMNVLSCFHQHGQRLFESYGRPKLKLEPKSRPGAQATHRYPMRSGFVAFVCKSLRTRALVT